MTWIVTGGAGFIGTNLVKYLRDCGHEVAIIDDLSRQGVRLNAQHLSRVYGIRVHEVDVSHRESLWTCMQSLLPIENITHLAGQVSLLNSIRFPMRDFEINAQGTLNLLEFVRRFTPDTSLVALSSNKIYGDLSAVRIEETSTRYVAPEFPNGFGEDLAVDCHGPYGCSKGALDQYVADYGRIYGLRTASLRQSSVFGPYQHPQSDQGWVAHMVEAVLRGEKIRLNGVGKQVRDLLHASDLARLLEAMPGFIGPSTPRQFNVGGGPDSTLSILELFAWLEENIGISANYACGALRPSDQKVYVSDITRVHNLTGWAPSVPLEHGLEALVDHFKERSG